MTCVLMRGFHLLQVKPGADIPDSLNKFTSCCALEHPQFPSGTFAIASRGGGVGIVQVREGGGPEEQSERSSVRSESSDVALKYNLLYELPVIYLLAAYLSQLKRDHPDVGVPAVVLALFKDPTKFKVYGVQSHPMYSNVLVLSTSAGICAVDLCNYSCEGTTVGTHPQWGNRSMIYADNCLKTISMKPNAVLLRGASEPATTTRNSFSRGNRTSSFNSDFNIADLADESSVSIDILDEFVPAADTAAIAASNAGPVGLNGGGGGANALPKAALLQSILATSTSRPFIFPSCSGKYCAVFWPESLFYIVLRVAITPGDASGRSEPAGGNDPARNSLSRRTISKRNSFDKSRADGLSKMVEVDRGMCRSLAWTSVSLGEQPPTSEGRTDASAAPGPRLGEDVCDLFCMMTVPRRVGSAAKRRSSIFGGADSKKPTGSTVKKSVLLIKELRSDGSLTDVTDQFWPQTVTGLVGGGAYLCVSSPVGDGAAKVNAVSKVEADAAASEAAAAKTASKTDDWTLPELAAQEEGGLGIFPGFAPAHRLVKSQFYRAVYATEPPAGSAEAIANAAAAQAAATAAKLAARPVATKALAEDGAAAADTAPVKAPAAAKLYLVPVGPVFAQVTSVKWDTSSGYVAVTCANSSVITVLKLDAGSRGAPASLQVLGSCELPHRGINAIDSVWWHGGTLFATTPIGIYAVFPAASGDSRLQSYAVAKLHQV
jgi:hypothetical protein